MDCRQPGFFFHGSFRQGYWNGLTFPSPTCPLEWPMSKTLTTLNAREDVEISFIASRNAKWYSHFGGQWQIPTKVSLLYHTVQKLDWLVFTRRNWKLCPNKILAGKRIILISFQVRKSDKRRSKICICSMFHILKLKVFSIWFSETVYCIFFFFSLATCPVQLPFWAATMRPV